MSNELFEDLGGPIHTSKGASRINKFPNTAHFPGSGPNGKICKDCIYFAGKARTDGKVFTGKCAQFVARQATITKIEDAGYIRASTAACKYFEGH